jgi:hypothetical protein
VEKFRNNKSQTGNMYIEKDAEIEFLQKEISSLMGEKSEKESIIKSNKLLGLIILFSTDL